MTDKTHRRWGILAFAVFMFFVTMVISNINGAKGASLYFYVWIMVGYYAYKARLSDIQILMKYLIYFNVAVAVLVMIFMDSYNLGYLKIGGKSGLLVGVLVMLVPKMLLFFYCKNQLESPAKGSNSSRWEQERSSQEGQPNTDSSFVTPVVLDSPSAIHINTVASKVAVNPTASSDEPPVNGGLFRPRSGVYSADAMADLRKQTTTQTNNTVSSSSANTDESIEEGYWAAAIAELESNQRRPGVWAKAFSDADGDTTKANAAYMKARVKQMHDLVQVEAAKFAAQQRDETAKIKALSLAKQQGIDEVVNEFLRSGTISEANLRLLIYQQDTSKTINLRDNLRGNTLLHICAASDMFEEVRALLAAGASPSVLNNQGFQPYYMTKNKDIRGLLDKGLKYPTIKK